ncbi:hypothetical protein Dsin_002198 [Dipteronia sinensis]|uniref:Uncharacterized protein n=1 Tax=Dipteronia sinensis TaxID=43782 RepID=A0AAE0EJR0_9ROSI|nr:hypothetical protein Dsin_002198 [Dipteronia sinensis]
MSSQSEDSLNPSLVRMIDDYQGDPSEVDLILSDSTSDSRHHDGVTIADPPTDSSVGEVGVHLRETIVVSRLATRGELNMESPSTSKGEVGRFLSDNLALKLSYVDVKKLEFELGIPFSVSVRAAAWFKWADWSILGWICFSLLPFKLGLRFPIPSMSRQLLNFFESAPGQLMPNGWRILLSLEVLIRREKLDFSFENFMYSYHLKEHDTDCGRYLNAAKQHRGYLISELTIRDPDWKPRFFFAQGVLGIAFYTDYSFLFSGS